MGAAKYKRVVLKLSGESLAGDQGFGINPAVVETIAKQIKRVHEEGKPEKIVEKMVDGRINKYYKEVCLVEQEFVKDSDKTIKDILGGVEVRRFARFEMGEGLEKKNEDFAAEVAAQIK